MNDIPDWAGKRACELLNENSPAFQWLWPSHALQNPVRTVAKLVMQHEQPPVDPDEEAVRRIFTLVLGSHKSERIWEESPSLLLAAASQYKQEKANG